MTLSDFCGNLADFLLPGSGSVSLKRMRILLTKILKGSKRIRIPLSVLIPSICYEMSYICFKKMLLLQFYNILGTFLGFNIITNI